MKKFILLSFLALTFLSLKAQRQITDSAVVQGYVLAAQPGVDNSFYTLVGRGRLGTEYRKWVLQKRDGEDLDITDSVIFNGLGSYKKIQSDDLGNIYLSIGVTDSITVPGYPTVYNLDGDSYKFVFAKITPDLEVDWIRTDLNVIHFGVSPNGQHLITRGNTWEYFSLNSIDPETGEVLASRQLPYFSHQYDIAVANNGAFYMSGSCADPVDAVDEVNIDFPSLYNYYYLAFDENMVAQWNYALRDISCAQPWMEMDDDGNMLFAAPLYKHDTIGGIIVGPEEPDDFSYYGFIITSTQADGTVNYAVTKPAGSDKILLSHYLYREIATQGNIAALGLGVYNYDQTTDWGNGIITHTDNGTWGEAVILEFDTETGEYLAVNLLNDYMSSIIRDLHFLEDGSIIVVGTREYPEYADFVIKLESISTGVEDIAKRDMKAYPNPSAGKVQLGKPVSGVLMDVTGREVARVENQDWVDLTGMRTGIYILQTERGQSFRLVRE